MNAGATSSKLTTETVISWEEDKFTESVAWTWTKYELFLSTSLGSSKSVVILNAKSPVDSSKVNLLESAPPIIDHVTVSLAVNCPIDNSFSFIDISLFKSPASPENPVISGDTSSKSVVVIVAIPDVSLPEVSVALILTT